MKKKLIFIFLVFLVVVLFVFYLKSPIFKTNIKFTNYYKDSFMVYYQYSYLFQGSVISLPKGPILKPIFGSDPETFKLGFGEVYYDKQNVYYRGETISGADGATFEKLSSRYFRDKKNVYCVRSRNDLPYVIEGLDVKEVEVLSQDSFIRDSKGIFVLCKRIEGADIASFHLLNREFSKDESHVYYMENQIEGADPKTFMFIAPTQRTDAAYYGKDSTSVYFKNHRLTGSDPETLTLLNPTEGNTSISILKDANHVYFNGKIITQADAPTFNYLNFYYSKDKNTVWYNFPKEPIEGADSASFEILAEYFAKDANHVYRDGIIFDGEIPKNFKPEYLNKPYE